MFTTYRNAEVQFSHLSDQQHVGTQILRYVEQELMYPWFYVQLAQQGATEMEASMLMLQHSKDLAEMVKCKTPSWRLEQVQIVTPAHMNGTGRWLIEPLDKITIHESPSLGGLCECFQVSSGNCYTIAGSGVLKNATLLRVIFDAETDLKSS